MDRIWDSLLASGPLAAVLACGLVVLWRKLQFNEQAFWKLLESKQAELTALHEQRVTDLKDLIEKSKKP